MLEDDADTDFRCLTAVSCYELSVEKLNLIKEKKEDMRAAYKAVEEEVFKPQFPLALDYIFHNNNERDYAIQLRKNQLRVKLKNAIMQTWSQVKKLKSPPSINELIDGILKTKKEKSSKGIDFIEEKKKNEMQQAKQQKKAQRNEDKEARKKAESKDSYLTENQFDFIYTRIAQARKSLKDQQEVIDMMEKKMLKIISARNAKEQKGLDKQI